MKCNICGGNGKIHAGACPKYIGAAGPCSCADAPLCPVCGRGRLVWSVLFWWAMLGLGVGAMLAFLFR